MQRPMLAPTVWIGAPECPLRAQATLVQQRVTTADRSRDAGATAHTGLKARGLAKVPERSAAGTVASSGASGSRNT